MTSRVLFEPQIVRGALIDSFRKLDPRHQARNPVMFVVLIGSVLTTALGVQALFGRGEAPAPFIIAISVWLWFTVLFGNFAEAMAEGRGKAQADTLRKSRQDVSAKKLSSPLFGASFTVVEGASLRKGDAVLARSFQWTAR
jgi:potassium-transporting ATPase ATP-binding subunit